MRPRARVAALLVVAVSTGACRFDGINSLPLPGNAVGSDSNQVTVEMADIQNLVGNSEVRSADVTIGTIRRVNAEIGIAVMTVQIDRNVPLPAGTTARLAQKSLLGAQYLQLDSPPTAAGRGTPVVELRDGVVIGVERTSMCPETEQLLAILPLLVYGGALDQIRTVTKEWGEALSGRGAVGVDMLDPALTVVREQQESLTSMLDAVDRFAADGRHVLDSSSDAIIADLKALRPVLDELAGAGSHRRGLSISPC